VTKCEATTAGPPARQGHAAVVIDRSVYIIFGAGNGYGGQSLLKDVWRLQVKENKEGANSKSTFDLVAVFRLGRCFCSLKRWPFS
jgi:hypothetical protein